MSASRHHLDESGATLNSASHMTNTRPSVLIYGYDRTLVETRDWVLARNGFDVGAASHIAEAEQIVREIPVDLLVICHTIPSNERQSAVATLQAIRPQLKVLLVTTVIHPVPEGPWQTVDALAGTEAMILATRRALNT